MKWGGINETPVFAVKQHSLRSPHLCEHSVLMGLLVAGPSVLADPLPLMPLTAQQVSAKVSR